MHKTRSLIQKLILSSIFIFTSTPVLAQIIPDNTFVGAEASQFNKNALVDIIDGGAIRGSNLFHSFREFNVNDGQIVYFSNPSGIRNILTRVTGGNASRILGILGVDGGANLFIMNPNGLFFGQNARLDVRGSFVGTTADSIKFADGNIFSAKPNQNTSLLTISTPVGLQMGSQPGQIVSKAVGRDLLGNPVNGIGVNSGTIALIGGEIILDDSAVFSNSGQVQLAALFSNTAILFDLNGTDFNFTIPNNVERAPVTLTNKAYIYAGENSPINIFGGDIKLNNSIIFADNGGDITISGRNIAVIRDGGVFNSSIVTSTFGAVSGGNLTLNAIDSLDINGGFVSIQSSGTGNAGNLTVQAGNAVNVSNKGSLSLLSLSSGATGRTSGKAGDITVDAQRVNLINSGNISTNTLGSVNAGNILIRAGEFINIRGAISPIEISSISSNTFGSSGDGGNVTIETPQLTVSQGGQINTASVQSQGNAGNINIRGKDVVVDGFKFFPNEVLAPEFQSPLGGVSINSQLSSNVGRANTNIQGGTITIDTERLWLSNGGNLSASVTSGQGRSGNIVVRATDSINIRGTGGILENGLPKPSGLFAELRKEGVGSGGSINIQTGDLNMGDGGQISTGTFYQGNAGNIKIRANSVDVRGQGTTITTQVTSRGVGNAGNLGITTNKLFVSNGAEISSNTFGQGNAGNLDIVANQIELLFSGGLFSAIASDADVNGGSITINTDTLKLIDNGGISSSNFGQGFGRAGDITINALDFIEVIGVSQDGGISTIASNTFGSGNAGRLNINTRRLSVRDGGFVTTSTNLGNVGKGGEITIKATDLVELVGKSPDGQLFSLLTTFTGGSGDAGQLNIDTRRLHIGDGGLISTATAGVGRGGNINIKASDVEILPNSINTTGIANGIFSSANSLGNSGDIDIKTQRLSIRNGGAISAGTALNSTGKGGNLTVNASDFVEVTGTSSNGALRSLLSVRSRGIGQAGDITVNSPRVIVQDKGVINAESFAANGGNIYLNSDLIVLRRQGGISATAGNESAGGNGGNIEINSKFIVAFSNENSDITANAFQGNGGNININTQGLFGIAPAVKPTSKSDITASSTLAAPGQISITQPDANPASGIIELPDQVVDATRQIAQACPRNPGAKPLGRFIITGRGSLPSSPLEVLPGTSNNLTLATLETSSNISNNSTKLVPLNTPDTIIEAQGWVKDASGSITLVTQAPNFTPKSRLVASVCPTL
ncbi:hypothetical protein NIES2101_38750 [Calothrix sp. HK-06]|nr:hypothetical protein NIES2101_38750 [Calothrix sp. HK-06]